MPCLNISTGLFINSDPSLLWKSANTTESSPNGTTIELENGGPNPGLTISHGGDNHFFQLFPSAQLHFIRFGTPANYILVLDVRNNGDRFVTLVDTTTVSGVDTEQVMFVNEPSTVGLPVVHKSPGSGSVFFSYSPSNSGTINNISIRRSDNGEVLCGAVPFSSSMQVTAEATDTQLLIKEGGSTVSACDRPAPECDVIPDTQTFDDAVLGSGVDPALITTTKTFKIKNVGSDCMELNSITDSDPFSVASTSPSLPVTLDPEEEVDVEVQFAPSSLGNYDETLAINPVPDNGDTELHCEAEAREATVSVSHAGTISFGRVLAGTSDSKELSITNNGEADIDLELPGSSSGLFQWSAHSATISPGDSKEVPITFSPATEGDFSETLNFTTNADDSPHSVNLEGAGCVPNAEIDVQVPTGPSISFGEVQQGFRTVRIITVRNNGDGPLNFDVRIQGTDANLFGLQTEGDSVTSPSDNLSLTVAPTDPCGGGTAGSGEIVFGVTFFADSSPGGFNAELVIENHNATNIATDPITHNLEAQIIEGVKTDVELVTDRSGSMAETSGARNKMQTAMDAGELFVQLARPDVEDRIGLIRFNDTPEIVPGFGIQNVTSANQDTIANAFNSSNFNPSGTTSIAGGVLTAYNNIDDNPRSPVPEELNTSVVVLTDGKDNTPYTNPADGETYTLIGEDGTEPLPTTADKQIYAIGIGDNIDNGRLGELAQGSGGEFLHVNSFTGTAYFKLEKHFTQIYMESVDLAIISDPVFEIEPHETHSIPFDVLKGDVSIMVVIYDRDGIRIPFYLKTPLGEIVELNNIPPRFQLRSGITKTARFMEVNMPEGEHHRYAGEWQAIIKHDGEACFHPGSRNRSVDVTHRNETNDGNELFEFGFKPTYKCTENENPVMYGIAIGAGSNFRMRPFIEPGVVKVGESIRLNAVVTEFGLPVLDCTVTVEAIAPDGTTTHHTLKDDGNHFDDERDDGNYGKKYNSTNQEGTYEFIFRTRGYSRDGEPVKREAVRSKYVEGRIPLIPEGDSQGSLEKCCSKMGRYLRIMAILLVILIALLVYNILG
ncbi:choice-of-anchor D domain-containing protein [Fodinibius halophilus]|uniref:Choice-of-anchor D domain-containing protein n=1 Tax=Fodinibius halophilus TaxID=1736908 RepID=A0A6M1T076_9BACT|nr:choice-of-anchor D domain-containing protein [Fodinibius halophilus]NGP89508.1 choice-of-anchor D domain-containing protein [Fodinibius halophilus]